MAPKSALSLLAAEVPEFSVRHGLAGPEVGDLDEHPLQAPGPHDPVVSARAPAPAAIPGSTPQSSSSPPALVHPGMDATLEHVFEQLSLPERLRGPLLALVGAEPTDDAETFSAITWEMYQADVVAQFEFEDGSRPTIFEKTRLLRFYKDLVKMFSDAPLGSSSSSTPSAPMQVIPNITVTVPECTDRHSMRDYIDQTNTEKFSDLSEKELTGLRSRFFNATGMDPLPEERPSDEQLAALAHLLRNMNAPVCRFRRLSAVRRPFGEASVVHCSGLQQRWVLGHSDASAPDSFQRWESSWQVFAASHGHVRYRISRSLTGLLPRNSQIAQPFSE